MQGYLFSRPVPADAVETMFTPKRRRAKARLAADPA
jgi:EAL domain-containing protein (putative c-di-GMP-specific phosphodiesterase class I)